MVFVEVSIFIYIYKKNIRFKDVDSFVDGG